MSYNETTVTPSFRLLPREYCLNFFDISKSKRCASCLTYFQNYFYFSGVIVFLRRAASSRLYVFSGYPQNRWYGAKSTRSIPALPVSTKALASRIAPMLSRSKCGFHNPFFSPGWISQNPLYNLQKSRSILKIQNVENRAKVLDLRLKPLKLLSVM